MAIAGSILFFFYMALQRTAKTTSSSSSKSLWILRHGQAMHNPRAEAARAAGCSKDEFLDWMRRDDALDAPLTDLGIQQAKSVAAFPFCVVPDVVVSSPLSRALHTADLACDSPSCHTAAAEQQQRRICYEGFREINGWLLNAKRRTKTELATLFPAWDFSLLSTEEDTLWGPELEDEAACGARGYEGLKWLSNNFVEEDSILLVTHGGLLSFTMLLEPRVMVRDERRVKDRPVKHRFGNCELRRYNLDVDNDQVILTEVDLDDKK